MTKTASKLLAIVLAGALAAVTFTLFTLQASADRGDRGGDGDRTEINTSNSATVSNGAIVVANTGGNRADGGDGDRGGSGGDASGAGMISVISSNDGGNGGNGGRGGDGGTITTGAAEAWGTIQNDVNNNRIVVEGCGCDEQSPQDRRHHDQNNDDGDRLEIDTRNRASVENGLAVMANTGLNSVSGGDAGRGGAGGDGRGAWFSWFSLYSDNDGGEGGNGGAGAAGGTVRTGTAYSNGLIANVVNSNVIRVNNGGR